MSRRSTLLGAADRHPPRRRSVCLILWTTSRDRSRSPARTCRAASRYCTTLRKCRGETLHRSRDRCAWASPTSHVLLLGLSVLVPSPLRGCVHQTGQVQNGGSGESVGRVDSEAKRLMFFEGPPVGARRLCVDGVRSPQRPRFAVGATDRSLLGFRLGAKEGAVSGNTLSVSSIINRTITFCVRVFFFRAKTLVQRSLIRFVPSSSIEVRRTAEIRLWFFLKDFR